MSESETQSDADSALRLARQTRRHLRIATLLAAEVPDTREEIAEHVRAAWATLHALRSRRVGTPSDPADADAASPAQIEPDFLPERERERFRGAMRALVGPDAAQGPPTLGELQRHLRWLSVGLAPAEARARREAGAPHPARRPLLATLAIVASIASVVGAAWAWQTLTQPTPRWRVTLYGHEDFRGRPVTSMHDEVDFRWGDSRPVFRIPNDHFSARVDSCLILAEPTTLEFFLLSDDGSRLYIDGKLAANNWGVHGEKSVVERLTVEPGTHHLLVEFFDRTKNARLTVGVDDSEGSPLSPEHFRPPTGAADSAAPCTP